MISHEHNCIFVHINKTAGQSVEKALGWDKHPKSDHRTIHDYPENYRERYFSFTIARNPFAKIVSMYHGRKQNLNSPIPQQLDFDEWLNDIHTRMPIHPVILRGTTNQLDWIASPQWEWSQEKGEYVFSPHQVDLKVDKIISFEHIKEGWKEICSIIGTDLKLPHINSSEHEDYSQYYNDTSISIVRKRFKRDLDYFDYSFNSS